MNFTQSPFASLSLVALLSLGLFSPGRAATYSFTNGQNNTAPITITGTTLFTIASGSATQSGEISDTSSATVSETGSGTLTFSNKVTLNGVIDISGARLISTGTGSVIEYLNIDYGPGSGGSIFEVAGGSVSIYTIYLANYSNGEIRVTNGGLLINRNTTDIGKSTGVGLMTVTGTGSEYRTTGGHDLALGQSGTGTVVVSNGGKISSTVGNPRLLFAESGTGKGTLAIGGASGAAAQAPGTVNFARIATGGGTGQIVFNHTSTLYNFTQDATASGASILIEGRTQVRVENGVTRLTGTNTYTGGTDIVGGELLISDAGVASVVGAGSVTVEVGGTLGGVGQVTGATSVAGILSPGNSSGTMTFQNGLSLAPTARLDMEIGGHNRGTDYDAIDVNGPLSLGGELRVIYTNGFTPQVGDTFDLFNGTFAASSNFTSIVFVSPGQGTFDPATGVLTVTSLVPEPSSLCLFAAAAWVVAWRLRRRQRTSR